ncbi:MAG TPA: Asp23/Gls24 family envelope stress response protein [Gaiellaceae bacterium]
MTEPLVFRGPEGSITVTPGALTKLVARAARSVDGVGLRRPKRAIDVRHGDGQAAVSIGLSARHGVPLPELANAVQERVTRAVAAVSGLEVERVDVEIEEVS